MLAMFALATKVFAFFCAGWHFRHVSSTLKWSSDTTPVPLRKSTTTCCRQHGRNGQQSWIFIQRSKNQKFCNDSLQRSRGKAVHFHAALDSLTGQNDKSVGHQVTFSSWLSSTATRETTTSSIRVSRLRVASVLLFGVPWKDADTTQQCCGSAVCLTRLRNSARIMTGVSFTCTATLRTH